MHLWCLLWRLCPVLRVCVSKCGKRCPKEFFLQINSKVSGEEVEWEKRGSHRQSAQNLLLDVYLYSESGIWLFITLDSTYRKEQSCGHFPYMGDDAWSFWPSGLFGKFPTFVRRCISHLVSLILTFILDSTFTYILPLYCYTLVPWYLLAP